MGRSWRWREDSRLDEDVERDRERLLLVLRRRVVRRNRRELVGVILLLVEEILLTAAAVLLAERRQRFSRCPVVVEGVLQGCGCPGRPFRLTPVTRPEGFTERPLTAGWRRLRGRWPNFPLTAVSHTGAGSNLIFFAESELWRCSPRGFIPIDNTVTTN